MVNITGNYVLFTHKHGDSSPTRLGDGRERLLD